MRLGTICLAGLVLALPAAQGLAQTAPSGLAGHQQLVQPRPAPHRRARPPRGPPLPGRAQAITPFVLTEVRTEGSTLTPAQLDAATHPFIGRTVDAAALQVLTDAIGKVYQNRSDIALYTVLAPEQDFAGGRLRLVVIEGYVEDVAIQGAHGHDMSLVKAYARQLTAERPLKRSTMQRYVSLIRDIPGLRADLQLIAGRAQGTVRVVIDVRPQPVQLGLGVNDRGVSLLGRTQVQADLYLNSLLRQGDQTRLSMAVPTETQLFQYYSAAHSQPVGSRGGAVTLFGGYLRTRPKNTGLVGHATSLGVQASYPVIRSYDSSLYVTAGVDGLDSANALFGLSFSNDHTRALRLGVSYGYSGKTSALSVSGAASFGLDGLGARVLNPALSDKTFHKVNLKAAYNRQIAPNWLVRLNGAAQLSGDLLPSAEQMTLGGEEFGRAYEASIVAGDYGYGASAELAFRAPKLPAGLKGSEAYVFGDDGKVWVRGRLGFPTFAYRVASAGGGVRLALPRHTVLQVEAARWS